MTNPGIVERTKRTPEAKQARRDEILAAARRVFAERGFRGTTIADIAEEASIALGTIYLYFASKDDVFAALSDQLNDLMTSAMTDVPVSETLEETVRGRISNVFAVVAENRDLVRLVVLNTDKDSAATKRLRHADAARTSPLVEVVSAGMESGFVRQSDAGIMTKLVVGLVVIAVYQAFVLGDGSEADKYCDGCIEMITAYMTPQAES